MSERYKKLFNLPEELYFNKSPVVLSASALFKDNSNDNIFIQLKFYSVDKKMLKAIKIKINTYSVTGEMKGEPVIKEYLDLNLTGDTFFGQKIPIFLSDNTIRSFDVSLSEVVYSDNTVEKYENIFDKKLPQKIKIDMDRDLLNTYREHFSWGVDYKPYIFEDLQLCACGIYNRLPYKKCRKCGLNVDIINLPDEELTYLCALDKMNKNSLDSLVEADRLLKTIPDYKDVKEQIAKCRQLTLIAQNKKRQEKGKQLKIEEEKKKNRIITILISIMIICLIVIIIMLLLLYY